MESFNILLKELTSKLSLMELFLKQSFIIKKNIYSEKGLSSSVLLLCIHSIPHSKGRRPEMPSENL